MFGDAQLLSLADHARRQLRDDHRQGVPAAADGDGPARLGAVRASASLYVFVAVVLPLAALLLTSFQRFATVILSQSEFTLANYQTAFGFGAVRSALTNSLSLGFGVATVGVALMAVLVWIIYRSQRAGARRSSSMS